VSEQERTATDADEIAFVNGRILTMDDGRPEVQALLTRGGRIRCMGTTDEVRAASGRDTEAVDLVGRVVIPGFVDGHAHLELTAVHLSYVPLLMAATYGSLKAICARLGEEAQRTPSGEWVVGRADFALHRFVEEKRPLLRSDLDAVVPDHPCAVFSGFHVVTLNSRALAVTGLLDGTAKVPMGSYFDLESGRGTELWDWLPLPTYGIDAIAAAIRDLGRRLWTARGVTTIAELPFTRDGVHALQQLRRAGELPTRIRMWMHVPRLGSIDDLLSVGLETGFGDEWLSIGGIKLFADGAGFDLDGNFVSDVKWTQEDLDEVVRKSHEAGMQVWIHTAPTWNGADMALTAYERALARLPRADHRHRIEHIGDMVPRSDFVERFQASGIIPVTTPQFTWSYGDETPEYVTTPLRSLHELGFRPPGNSDASGSQPEAINPWHSIRCAMSHRTRSGALVHPEERIELLPALRMFTRDAAWACHLDDRGILAPGYLADLVVLGVDPFTLAPDELPEIPTDMTVMGGEVAWQPGIGSETHGNGGAHGR
jgi:predicted amidohydrolase YtcJ